jgi:hypothetical protein
MKKIALIFTCCLFALLTGCSNLNSVQKDTFACTTQEQQDVGDKLMGDQPYFDGFNWGSYLFSLNYGGFYEFPVKVNNVDKVAVRIYKINKDNFLSLWGKLAMARTDGFLDLSELSEVEKKPIFEGDVQVVQDYKYSLDPREGSNIRYKEQRFRDNGKMLLPIKTSGFYYIEFPAMIDYDERHSLLQLVDFVQ